MNIEQQIEVDLKQALLAGDKLKASTLRGIKSAIQYEIVGQGAKESGLSQEEIQKVLAREAKKRSESAEAYKKAGASERAEAELAEKTIIEEYLPEQASEEEVSRIVNEEIAKLGNFSQQDMGKVIGAVRAKLGATADGGLIARLVKEQLGS